jgi:hypothetical protein
VEYARSHGGRNRKGGDEMDQTPIELLDTITPIDDQETHAFVEYIEWMKSADYTDVLLDTLLSDSDNAAPGVE